MGGNKKCGHKVPILPIRMRGVTPRYIGEISQNSEFLLNLEGC